MTGVLPHRTVSLWREGEHGLDCIREVTDVLGFDEVAVAALVDEVGQGHCASEDQGVPQAMASRLAMLCGSAVEGIAKTVAAR